MADINDYVRMFAHFLTSSRPLAESFFPSGSDELNDWVQASWELLVESKLERGVALYPYNGGADCYGTSARVFRPELEATHAVTCLSESGLAIDYLTGTPIALSDSGFVLQELVTVSQGMYMPAPPFDHVRVGDHIRQHVFRLADLRLELRPVDMTELA